MLSKTTSVLTLLVGLTTAAQVRLNLVPATARVTVDTEFSPTVNVHWDRIAQEMVVSTPSGPTKAADVYGTMHTAIYDAWASYHGTANPTASKKRMIPKQKNTPQQKAQAMSVAASIVLRSFFPGQNRKIRDALSDFGASKVTGTPKVVGRRAAQAVMKKYNRAIPTDRDESPWNNTDFTNEVERWTPENTPIDDPNAPLQTYLSPFFGRNKTFGIANGKAPRPVPPKRFLTVEGAQVNVKEKKITIPGGQVLDVTKDLIGTVINASFIEQAEEVISASRELNDRTKLFAEFWEGAGGTSTPPGLWMTFGQYVSARDEHTTDEDAQMFLALSNAVRDSGIATWNAKLYYYYARPVRVIRDLGDLGLVGEFDESLGANVISAYDVGAMKQGDIAANKWNTYQRPNTEPSPPFPEYTSGHSGFSAAGAEVLKLWTGKDDFGAFVTYEAGSSRFEPGKTPEEPTTLSWETFKIAADEAATSRLAGGIHFEDGNNIGKNVGREAGFAAYKKALRFIKGKAGKNWA